MLNIKDPEAHALAKKLAERRKTSMTKAVVDALRRDLDRTEAEERTKSLKRRRDLMAFLTEFWKTHPPTGKTLKEMDDEIYDEFGLPR